MTARTVVTPRMWAEIQGTERGREVLAWLEANSVSPRGVHPEYPVYVTGEDPEFVEFMEIVRDERGQVVAAPSGYVQLRFARKEVSVPVPESWGLLSVASESVRVLRTAAGLLGSVAEEADREVRTPGSGWRSELVAADLWFTNGVLNAVGHGGGGCLAALFSPVLAREVAWMLDDEADRMESEGDGPLSPRMAAMAHEILAGAKLLPPGGF